MNQLIDITKPEDIVPAYRHTPIGKLLEYHNLDRATEPYTAAEILIGMCMDHRKRLRIPENFAYIIRTAGANLQFSDFNVSYAVAIAGVRYMAVIGHTDCGMMGLESRKHKFVEGLVDAGWQHKPAEMHFNKDAPLHEIGNEVEFVLKETSRIREKYPAVMVVPMLYKVEDNKLYLIDESQSLSWRKRD